MGVRGEQQAMGRSWQGLDQSDPCGLLMTVQVQSLDMAVRTPGPCRAEARLGLAQIGAEGQGAQYWH